MDSPTLSPSTPASELPLGVPATYWLDLRTYDPLATAAGLHVPMFFSQGGRDYQVPPGELTAWQRALAGRSDVTFKVYPSLDHLLLAGTGVGHNFAHFLLWLPGSADLAAEGRRTFGRTG